MNNGGPLLHCPSCKELLHCRSVPLAKAKKEKARSLYFLHQIDIHWYRRARQCQKCSEIFITAEVDEKFLDELVALRKRLLKSREDAVIALRVANPWIERSETISKELAQGFIRRSCWWLTHSSGSPVLASGFADKIYLDKRHGWAVNFGANAFLVGKAIERSGKEIKKFLDAASSGKECSIDVLKQEIRYAIAGAVANHDGNEYGGHYPISGNELVFGAHAIDLNHGTSYLLAKVDVEKMLKERPL